MILTLKQMSVLLIVSVFFGVTIVWGLKATTAVEKTGGEGVMVEASHFPLKLMMMLNRTTFKASELVNFTLFLYNIGNETVTLHYIGPIDHTSFVVYGKDGSKVYDDDDNRAWLAWYAPPSPLPPGFGRWGVTPWHKPHDFPSGTYQIAGQFKSYTLNFTIETPPVTITIT